MTRGLVLCLLAVAGCLPGDDRPEAGSLFVSAEPSAAISDGVTTDDGWTITFDRLLTALGDIRLYKEDNHDGDCNDYANTRYEWLFDFTVATREKVGIVYGLGQCSVEFSMREPSGDTVLGAGTTQADYDAMIIRDSDGYTESREAVVRVIGDAARDGVSKSFDWTFRRRYDVKRCRDAGGSLSTLQLNGGDDRTFRLEMRGEALFRQNDDSELLGFDRIAAADADEDGAVTLDELGDVELDEEMTLADWIYEENMPRMASAVGASECDPERDDRRRR